MADTKAVAAKARSAATALTQQQPPLAPPISLEPRRPLSSTTSTEDLIDTDPTQYVFNGGDSDGIQQTQLPIVEGSFVEPNTDPWFWNGELLDNGFFDQGYFLWRDDGYEYPC